MLKTSQPFSFGPGAGAIQGLAAISSTPQCGHSDTHQVVSRVRTHWLEILSSHQSADPGGIHIRLNVFYNPEAMPGQWNVFDLMTLGGPNLADKAV